LKAGKSQEAVTILTEAESLIANATDSERSFLCKNSLLDLANKNVEANANFLLLQKHIKI
jgi:hypothetical protein